MTENVTKVVIASIETSEENTEPEVIAKVQIGPEIIAATADIESTATSVVLSATVAETESGPEVITEVPSEPKITAKAEVTPEINLEGETEHEAPALTSDRTTLLKPPSQSSHEPSSDKAAIPSMKTDGKSPTEHNITTASKREVEGSSTQKSIAKVDTTVSSVSANNNSSTSQGNLGEQNGTSVLVNRVEPKAAVMDSQSKSIETIDKSIVEMQSIESQAQCCVIL